MPKYLDYNGFIHYNEGLNKKFLGKVDKIAGKNLSTNDYTNSEKEKLKGIASNAQVNTIENISIDGVKLQISNKNINIPLATKTQLGLVKIGDNLNIDNGVLSVSRNITGDTLPIGSTVEWWCEEAPENWLICNGQAVSRTDYKDLFNVIGTQYGAGDGNTTFNLPNLSGRVPVGLTATEGDNYKLLGNKGGSKTHLLTTEEMPSHTHDGETSDAKTSFMRAVSAAGDFYARNHTVSNGSGSYSDYSRGSSDFPGANHYHTFVTSSSGGDKAFDIMPSYIVSHFIIKAKQGAPIVATVKDNLTSESTSDALSANQGRILNEKISNLENLSSGKIVISEEEPPTENTKLWVNLATNDVKPNALIGDSYISKVLYLSEEGKSTDITLNENCTDYDFLLFQYYYWVDLQTWQGSTLYAVRIRGTQDIAITECYEGSTYTYNKYCWILLKENKIVFKKNTTVQQGANSRVLMDEGPITIFKITGYKKMEGGS